MNEGQGTHDKYMLKGVLGVPEVCKSILSWLDLQGVSSELASLDLTCKAFRLYTIPKWDEYCQWTFGVDAYGLPVDKHRAGRYYKKTGLRRVAGLLRPPVCFEIKEDVEFATGVHSPMVKMTCGGNLLATRTSPWIDGSTTRTGIILRDAGTLSRIKDHLFDYPFKLFAVCGKPGQEIIVTAFNQKTTSLVRAVECTPIVDCYRGGIRRRICENIFRPIGEGSGIKALIGSESHLVAATQNTVYLFEISTAEFFTYLGKTNYPNDKWASELYPRDIRWSSEAASWVGGTKQFGILHCNSNEEPDESFDGHIYEEYFLSFWEINEKSNKRKQTSEPFQFIKQIRLPHGARLFAFSKRFVVVSDHKGGIHVFHYKSGQLVRPAPLCDTAPRGFEVIHMEIIENSDILVATSNEGNALCVWNMQSGELLKRFRDAFSLNISFPHTNCVASMVRLRETDKFSYEEDLPITLLTTMTDGVITVWSFPCCRRTDCQVRRYAQREKYMKSAIAALNGPEE